MPMRPKPMRTFARLVLAAIAALATMALGETPAVAGSTVKWLYIETNPEIIQYWKDVIAKYEKAHPGVTIETQFLRNEAYKAKLPTLLQSTEPPHIFYSWAGGVLHTQ